MKKLIVAIDFDGTCVEHAYPAIGEDIGAWPVIHELHNSGVCIILFTMRSGKELDAAIEEFGKRNITLYGVNRNPDQHRWTASAKPYAHLCIDDAALGVPLVHTSDEVRPYVDWQAVRKMLIQRGYLKGIAEELSLTDDETPQITIPQVTYLSMQEEAAMMQKLRNAGVENWEGWDVAIASAE